MSEEPGSSRGRPKKKEVEAVKKGNRRAVGRPKGDAGIMNEYKARMLASPKSRKVLDAIFSAALDDDHKNQAKQETYSQGYLWFLPGQLRWR